MTSLVLVTSSVSICPTPPSGADATCPNQMLMFYPLFIVARASVICELDYHSWAGHVIHFKRQTCTPARVIGIQVGITCHILILHFALFCAFSLVQHSFVVYYLSFHNSLYCRYAVSDFAAKLLLSDEYWIWYWLFIIVRLVIWHILHKILVLSTPLVIV